MNRRERLSTWALGILIIFMVGIIWWMSADIIEIDTHNEWHEQIMSGEPLNKKGVRDDM